ncbi:MAG: hypothetical protein AAF846_26930 [Chloroflexota bacterium]
MKKIKCYVCQEQMTATDSRYSKGFIYPESFSIRYYCPQCGARDIKHHEVDSIDEAIIACRKLQKIGIKPDPRGKVKRYLQSYFPKYINASNG